MLRTEYMKTHGNTKITKITVTVTTICITLNSWIQENTELKKTMESTVERAYIYGRKFIAAKVKCLIYNVLHYNDYYPVVGNLQRSLLQIHKSDSLVLQLPKKLNQNWA